MNDSKQILIDSVVKHGLTFNLISKNDNNTVLSCTEEDLLSLIRYSLHIGQSEGFKMAKELYCNDKEKCKTCHGHGVIPTEYPALCPNCEGKGE